VKAELSWRGSPTNHQQHERQHTRVSKKPRAVHTALLLIDSPTDQAGVYTPMTRGRQANHAYVITDENQTHAAVLCQAISREWIDQPTVAQDLQLDPGQPAPGQGRRQPDRRARLAPLDHGPHKTTSQRRSPDRGLSL
jgi:hypothetical protein